jgi:hypothetical protein
MIGGRLRWTGQVCLFPVSLYSIPKCFLRSRSSVHLSLTEIDPLQCLSVSSLISKVCHKNGCFEGVLPVKNILRKFLQQSVYGGRVCVNPLYEGKKVEGKFQYLDAVYLCTGVSHARGHCTERSMTAGCVGRLTHLTASAFMLTTLNSPFAA